MNGKAILFILFSVVIMAICSNVRHDFLWGPDEPRDAEIAREVLIGNYWIVPRLCGLPFLEKPPLYYDLEALSFKVSGSISPTTARAVSCILGLFMLLPVFFFGYQWGGLRRGMICMLLLAGMPQFFRYSHWILVDIGVGTFCTLALSLFAWWYFWPSSKPAVQHTKLSFFYLVCAFAFLAKGTAAFFHIVVIVGFFIAITFRLKNRRETAKGLFSPLPILFFMIPVGLWLFLFYNEGGTCYLHEHFVNNLAGRFLHRHFELAGCNFYHTDIGNFAPWYEYLQRLPDMIGITYIFLPFAAWKLIKNFRKSASGQPIEIRDININIYLAIWTFLPGILLSFAAQKEVSYLLPSYAGTALFTGGWIDSRLPVRGNTQFSGIYWILLVVPVALASFFLPELMDTRNYMFLTGGFIALFVPLLFFFLFKKQCNQALFLALAIQLGAVIIGNTPKVLYDTRLHEKTYEDMAYWIGNRAGRHNIYLFCPDDYLRGSVAFYNNRLTPELDRIEDLEEILETKQDFYILGEKEVINSLKDIPGVKSDCISEQLPDFQYKADYSLLLCNNNGEGVNRIN